MEEKMQEKTLSLFQQLMNNNFTVQHLWLSPRVEKLITCNLNAMFMYILLNSYVVSLWSLLHFQYVYVYFIQYVVSHCIFNMFILFIQGRHM